ncbi:hypothetical protein NDU88_010585 [Pleurodeles waltl]|uniref:Uncharacterized protein n=1 Tax=Pleurodeles waltl TaxID=8319 RepID=A0AAV7QUU4_PLEWA|nr:hypothetical protein NDU88_010585 [Pleurodeles waltl]
MGAEAEYPWGTPPNARTYLHSARPDEVDVLGGTAQRPGRKEVSEGRARRETRVLEERDDSHLVAAVPEKTEAEEKEEAAAEGRHHAKQRASIEKRPRGIVSDEEASHVPEERGFFERQAMSCPDDDSFMYIGSVRRRL